MVEKKWIYIILSILFFVLIGLFIAGLMISNTITNSSSESYLFENHEKAEDHIVVILDKTGETYRQAFEYGIKEAAKTNNIVVEIMEIDGSNFETEVLKAMDKAMYSKADAIILDAYKGELVEKKIDEIYNSGIPIITINQDIPNSSRVSYVGVNRYNIGLTTGESFVKLLGEEGKIAVIEKRSYQQEKSVDEKLVLLGINEVFKQYPDLTIETIEYSEEGELSSETVALRIFQEYPDISGIFCTDELTTRGVVQFLIDSNHVDNVVLIGFGNDLEIIQHIEKGNVVEASIVTDYKEIGRKVINGYLEYKMNNFVSNYIKTDFLVIDQENVKKYIDEMGDFDD